MRKFFIYVTDEPLELKVFGREVFVEDGMLCCANPAMAMECAPGDVFCAMLDHDAYGTEEFDVKRVSLPSNLNSLVAWMCGFSAERRCTAWRWKYNRHSFKTHVVHPTELRYLDERIIPNKLCMAVVRSADATKAPIRLWAGIDAEDMTAADVLSVADLLLSGVRSQWVVLKLKEHGIDIELNELNAARSKKGGERV